MLSYHDGKANIDLLAGEGVGEGWVEGGWGGVGEGDEEGWRRGC